MTTPAGFSERVFEFAFNAEFAAKNKAILAACPFIPTQQQENDKAFDVEFELKNRGGAITSLFLQHKVSRHVENRSASNAVRWDAMKGPYLCFDLDIDQYNKIHDLRVNTGEEIYYCAPSFVRRGMLDSHYMSRTVTKWSVWVDVKKAGEIADKKCHSIVYVPAGAKAIRTSEEAHPVTLVEAGGSIRDRRRYQHGFDQNEARLLYENLFKSIEQTRHRALELDHRQSGVDGELLNPIHRDVGDRRSAILAIQELAAEYLKVSWLLVTEE